MSNAPKLGSVAVVIHDNKVLLVQRKKQPNAGLWGFPGGHIELGETGLACAVRELQEETGVTAKPLRYITNIDLIRHLDGGAIAFHYLLAVVECEYQAGVPVAADDAANAAWFSVSQVAEGKLDLTDNVREITLSLCP